MNAKLQNSDFLSRITAINILHPYPTVDRIQTLSTVVYCMKEGYVHYYIALFLFRRILYCRCKVLTCSDRQGRCIMLDMTMLVNTFIFC